MLILAVVAVAVALAAAVAGGDRRREAWLAGRRRDDEVGRLEMVSSTI